MHHKDLNFVDWELSKIKDLTHHLNYRNKHDIEERCRWMTQWNMQGWRNVTPGLWCETCVGAI